MIRCDACGSTRIGVEEFQMYGTHHKPYCVACSDREKNPSLDKGETLDQHTHKWEARNGRYGGFVFCAKCGQTISAARDEHLFRRVCTYKIETIEKAISLARASCNIHTLRPPPPIVWHDTPSKGQSHRGSGDDSGYNDVMHDWDEPGAHGGDGYNDPFFYGGDDGGW